MKQGIANIWLLGMIIVFIAMFSAYIATTINYSKAFKMKNEMLSIIEKHHGVTSNLGQQGESVTNPGQRITVDLGAAQTINYYLRGMGYNTKGKCPRNNDNTDVPGTWYGVYDMDLENKGLELFQMSELVQTSEKKYYWCFAKYDAQLRTGTYTSAYYKVRVFYGFDLPVLSTFLSVKVDGMSDEVYDLQDSSNNPDIDSRNIVQISSENYDYVSRR
ncbi:MAG: hypothetical protein IKP07_01680 [Bacilli bacterium]|nr:hypothetical protein [Bacilli bacterium]